MNFLALFGNQKSLRQNNGEPLLGATRQPGPHARSALRAQDEILSDSAHSWVRQLPGPSRPLELCNAYPRVANRIAESWADLALTTAVLDDLLVDHRGGRRGFPAQIAVELLRLQALHEDRSPDRHSYGARCL